MRSGSTPLPIQPPRLPSIEIQPRAFISMLAYYRRQHTMISIEFLLGEPCCIHIDMARYENKTRLLFELQLNMSAVKYWAPMTRESFPCHRQLLTGGPTALFLSFDSINHSESNFNSQEWVWIDFFNKVPVLHFRIKPRFSSESHKFQLSSQITDGSPPPPTTTSERSLHSLQLNAISHSESKQ